MVVVVGKGGLKQVILLLIAPRRGVGRPTSGAGPTTDFSVFGKFLQANGARTGTASASAQMRPSLA